MTAKLILIIVVTLACLFLRFPVYASMLISAVSLALIYPDFMPLVTIGTGINSGLSTASLNCIIFFMFAGELMTRGGIAEKIVRFFRACIGHVQGSLSHVNVLESTVFAGVSGSSMADTVAMTNLLVPAMIKDGYSPEYSVAMTLASSNIGPIIPPSSGLILLALWTGANIQQVIMGGLVPGLFMAAVLLAYSYYISKKRNYPKGEWLGFRNILTTLKTTWAALLMPILVIGCLSMGIGTVDEVGAGTVFYCLFIGLIVDRDLSLKDVWGAAVSTAKSTGQLLCINAAAGVFNWIVASLGMRTLIQNYMAPLTDTPILLMLVIFAIYFVGGCFMNHMVLLCIIAPLLAPIAAAAGYDIVAFCVLSMIVVNMGQITPPVGQLIFVGSTVTKVPATKIIKELWPFIFVISFTAITLIFFPQIAYALPRFLYG